MDGMKKLIENIIGFAIAVILIMNVYYLDNIMADDSNSIYSDDNELSSEAEESVNIKIKNNTGYMGFKIHIEYETDKIDVISVASGELTSEGIFQDNLGQNNGVFDVVWSGTEDISRDGTMFMLIVKAKNGYSGKTGLTVTFSQEDTFNEKWEDVVFNCNDIILNFATDNITDKNSEDVQEKKNNDIDDEFIDEVVSKLDENKFRQIVSGDTKATEGEISRAIEDIDENFVNKIIDELADNGVDIKTISNKTYEEKRKIIEKVVKKYNEILSKNESIEINKHLKENKKEKVKDTFNVKKIIVVSVCAVTILVIVFVVKKMKDRRK